MIIVVNIESWEGRFLHSYTFDYSDPKQRAVFAEQAGNALTANQQVYTCKQSPPAGVPRP